MEGLQRRGREMGFSGLLTGRGFPPQAPGALPRAFSGSETVSTTQSRPTPHTIPRTQGTSTLPAQPSGGTALRAPCHLPGPSRTKPPCSWAQSRLPSLPPRCPPLPALRPLGHLPSDACTQPVPGSASGGTQPEAALTWFWLKGGH